MKFCIRYCRHGKWYGDIIGALDWDEAEEICRREAWQLDGEYIMSVPYFKIPYISVLIYRVKLWLEGKKDNG